MMLANGRHHEAFTTDLDSALETIHKVSCTDDVGCPDLERRVAESIRIIEHALSVYNLEELALSFNGGKDCVVLIHLLYLVARKRNISLAKLCAAYWDSPRSFAEVTEFVKWATTKYGFRLIIFEGSYKQGMEEMVSKYNIKAIFMGVRRTDPHGSTLDYFTPTTEGWPAMVRISPLLDWTYHEIWAFILALHVPYCSLYDRGYTSLGHVDDTIPNPELKHPSGDGYYPGYKLQDGSKERAGRLSLCKTSELERANQ